MIVIANSLSEVPTATQDAADRVYVREDYAKMLGPSFKDRKGGGDGFILSNSMEQSLGLDLPPEYKWGDDIKWTQRNANSTRRGVFVGNIRGEFYDAFVLLEGDYSTTKVFYDELRPA